MPSPAEFATLLAKRRGTLKGLLLNQSFAAGVGNWIADEVLYQAHLDPRRHVDTLDAQEIRAMHRCLSRIIRTAVDANANKRRFPKTWLFHMPAGVETRKRPPATARRSSMTPSRAGRPPGCRSPALINLLGCTHDRAIDPPTGNRNVLGGELIPCSIDPMTGFYRTGCCGDRTG